jgi:hypothetical protein
MSHWLRHRKSYNPWAELYEDRKVHVLEVHQVIVMPLRLSVELADERVSIHGVGSPTSRIVEACES